MKLQRDWREELKNDLSFSRKGKKLAMEVGEKIAYLFEKSEDPWEIKSFVDRLTTVIAGAQGSRNPDRAGKMEIPSKCKQPRRPIKVTDSDYVGWHNEAERRIAAGWTQERCSDCGLWSRWYTPAETEALSE